MKNKRKTKKLSILVLLIFTIFLNDNSINAQNPKIHAQKIDSLISIAIDKYKFNGAILVAEKGKVIYKKVNGYSNFKTKEKLTINSMFTLASLSKAFTAMGIMILKESGKLDFENDMQKYFPGLPYKGITIRNLLNHTSGLPDYERLLKRKWDRKKIADNNDVFDMLKKYQPKIIFNPGGKYEYCNTGYVILASIIEKISGLSFRDYLQKNIFDKLNMNRTKVLNRRLHPEIITDFAYGHVFSIAQRGYVFPDNVYKFNYVYFLDGIVGDGCVNSTIEDLYIWDQALYSEKLVSSNLLSEAFTPPVLLNKNAKTDYGFGWHINNTPHGKVIKHGGSYAGYINKFVRNVDKKQTLIVLTNNSFKKYYSFFNSILYVLNDNYEFTLPKLHFDVKLSRELIKKNMKKLKSKVELMLSDQTKFHFNENNINNLGYELLNSKRIEDAIEVFKINVRVFPKSGNVYDSLGEAYIKAKQTKLAIKSYEKACELDPKNKNAKDILKQLKKKD